MWFRWECWKQSRLHQLSFSQSNAMLHFFCIRLNGFSLCFCYICFHNCSMCNFHLAFKMHSMLNCGSVRLTLLRCGQASATKRETDKWRGINNVIIMFSYAIRKKCVVRVFSPLVFPSELMLLLLLRLMLLFSSCCEGFSNVHSVLDVYTFWCDCVAYAIAKKTRSNNGVTT